MKKVIFILGFVFSLIIILVSIYMLIKINFIFSNSNGQLYDGFGTLYNNEKPNSPFTIIGIVGIIGGWTLAKICYLKIKSNKKEVK